MCVDTAIEAQIICTPIQ
uniref:Uncharacterized protein n=1 Tax=Arundo donax TaxID=35708 RepID=A0A0A8ZTZ5_ARUDO